MRSLAAKCRLAYAIHLTRSAHIQGECITVTVLDIEQDIVAGLALSAAIAEASSRQKEYALHVGGNRAITGRGQARTVVKAAVDQRSFGSGAPDRIKFLTPAMNSA